MCLDGSILSAQKLRRGEELGFCWHACYDRRAVCISVLLSPEPFAMETRGDARDALEGWTQKNEKEDIRSVFYGWDIHNEVSKDERSSKESRLLKSARGFMWSSVWVRSLLFYSIQSLLRFSLCFRCKSWPRFSISHQAGTQHCDKSVYQIQVNKNDFIIQYWAWNMMHYIILNDVCPITICMYITVCQSVTLYRNRLMTYFWAK